MSKITEENYFEKLSKISVKEHTETKGKFSYLSWAWAVDTLRKSEPTATWEVIRFNGLPFLETNCGYFVEVAVTVKGITLSQIHPVLDNYNKPLVKPNSFQINTSIQRALVKAIALHGLGLYIYAGEDLPEGEEKLPQEPINKTPEKSPLQNLADGCDEELREAKEAHRLTKLKESIDALGSKDEIDKFLAYKHSGKTRLEILQNMSEINAAEAKRIIDNAKMVIDNQGLGE